MGALRVGDLKLIVGPNRQASWYACGPGRIQAIQVGECEGKWGVEAAVCWGFPQRLCATFPPPA